jgi:glycerol-3-phosphate O-acyltransferase
MAAAIKPSTIRPLFYVFNKMWQRVFDQIIVNEVGLNQVRDIFTKGKDNVVLIPTHKSYVDNMLISYIHYFYKMQMPFTFGDQQLVNLTFVRFLLKNSGAFYINS